MHLAFFLTIVILFLKKRFKTDCKESQMVQPRCFRGLQDSRSFCRRSIRNCGCCALNTGRCRGIPGKTCNLPADAPCVPASRADSGSTCAANILHISCRQMATQNDRWSQATSFISGPIWVPGKLTLAIPPWLSTLSSSVTRKLCYCKDDRAMQPECIWCLFKESD